MIKILLFFLGVSSFTSFVTPDEPLLTNLGITQPHVEGTPGTTFFNQIDLSNNSDQISHVQLKLMAPMAFRLLTQLPAVVTMAPHSTRKIPLKFLIDRNWTDPEAIVRIETTQNDPATVSVVQFVVQQNRTAPSVLTFVLVNETPYVTVGQDTLPLSVHFSNQGPRARTVRLSLFSVPGGFRFALPHPVLTIGARRDTIVTIPCFVSNSVQWDRTYELAVEAQEVETTNVSGPLLGSVVCRPILLASTKRWVDSRLGYTTPNGISLGVSRFGSMGLVRELRAWGREAVAKGTLTYQAYYLNYASQRYHELRDTYLQYQQANFMLRVGSLYDYHELPLIGVGVKFAQSLNESTKLEGWALRNQSNWLANLPAINQASLGLIQPVADQTYSLRLSGGLPLPGEAVYQVSSSYYVQQRYSRAGLLNFAAIQWLPDVHSKLRFTAGQSLEHSPGRANRQQTVGWALGGGYDRATTPVDIHASVYLSNPVYGGIQRGAALIDHSLIYKKWRTTQLAYRYSQVQYDQRIYTAATEISRRQYGNTVGELTLLQQLGRLTWLLRPYYWWQRQSLPDDTQQRIESLRMLTSLRYETLGGLRLEAGVDGGRFKSQAPPPDRFVQPSFRYFGSLGINRLNLMGVYQRGPFLINDRLPGQGNPADYRQVSVSPSWQFGLFTNRLQVSVGAGLTYNSIVKSWNGLSYNSATYAVSDNLRLRIDANLISYASQLNDITAVPWQDSQLRFEVVKLFRRSPFKTSRTLRLRFFEDENGNQQKDGNEHYIDGLVVNIGSTALITDKKGVICSKDIASGLHRVRTICKLASGEPVWFQDTVRVGKSLQRDMAIRKTWRVSGQLRYSRTRYENQSYDLEQHRIETSGPAGEVYRTYADAQGRFTLYLPVGQYQLDIVPIQTPTARKTISYRVEQGVDPAGLQIELEPAGRPVQIKRFSSR